MSTVYSLVCWGGKDGKTATLSIASPCVVTITNHGLRDGAGVVFSTTGALPTGITAGTTYYAKSIAANTFNLYTDAALTTIVNTSGSQSGTHTAKGAYYLGLADKSRWTTDSTERIYNGIFSWRDARYTALTSTPAPYDSEVCEIGEAFTEYNSGMALNLNMNCAAITVTTSVDTVRSPAFHGGRFSDGYCLSAGNQYNNAINLNHYFVCLDGIRVFVNKASTCGVHITKPMCEVKNCIFYTDQSYNTDAISMETSASDLCNNIVHGFTKGISVVNYTGIACKIYNNLCSGCTIGFNSGGSSVGGIFINNIGINNSTNWGTQSSGIEQAAYNGGVSGDSPWNVGSATAITSFVTTTGVDFVDVSNNDYRPYSASSKQVEAGVVVYLGDASDIVGDVRPNYKSSSHPNESWDIGPFEYDHGEGLAPSSVPISITGMASGSEFAVYKASDMSQIVAPTSTTGSYSGTYTYTGDTNVIVRVRKGTASTRYLPYEYVGTITSTGFQLVVSQVVDTIAQ